MAVKEAAKKTVILTRSDVLHHASRKSCWVIIDGIVYNVTDFLDSHPGGARLILNYGGRDATKAFADLHSADTIEKHLTPQQTLGMVDIVEPSETASVSPQASKPKVRLSSLLNIDDFEKAASQTLPPESFAFFKSGAEDEYASNWNLDSWKAIRLRPRVLRPISNVNISTDILGTQWSAPFFICPAGGGKLANPSGEVLLTNAAGKHDILHWVCNNAGCSMSEIANSCSNGQVLYWQIYPKSDLRESEKEVRKAISLGYKAFALTVDAVRAGSRERDLRVGLERKLAGNTIDDDDDQDVDFANGQTVKRAPVYTEFTWTSAVEWLRGLTNLPIAIKGIQCWEDAAQCLLYEDVHPWLSNHGGRQIDSAPSALETLVSIRKHCPELRTKREIIVDGGITRGADIVKALALGAKGVGLGRAFLYALVFGEVGVSKAIRMLKNEVETTMALVGVTSIRDLGPSHVDTSGLERGVVYLKPRL